MKYWRDWIIFVGATLLGLIVALYMRTQINPQPGVADLQPNLWTVIAVPLAALLGALLSSFYRRWSVAAWLLICYIGAVFGAARLERLTKDVDLAAADGHSLYFLLVPLLQSLLVLVLGTVLLRSGQSSDEKEQML